MPDEQKQHAERLLDIVNDTARAVGTRFVTFLTVGVYVALTIAATTDEMVVRPSLVTLPLLNTKIPISGLFGFYTIAPWLIVFLHWDLLLQLSMLDGKLSRFRGDVDKLPAEGDAASRPCGQLVLRPVPAVRHLTDRRAVAADHWLEHDGAA